jgi:hypothetical protein
VRTGAGNEGAGRGVEVVKLGAPGGSGDCVEVVLTVGRDKYR